MARFNSWVRKLPWSRKWQSPPVYLPGKFHGQRSLAGYSPRSRKSQTWLSSHAHAGIRGSVLIQQKKVPSDSERCQSAIQDKLITVKIWLKAMQWARRWISGPKQSAFELPTPDKMEGKGKHEVRLTTLTWNFPQKRSWTGRKKMTVGRIVLTGNTWGNCGFRTGFH